MCFTPNMEVFYDFICAKLILFLRPVYFSTGENITLFTFLKLSCWETK